MGHQPLISICIPCFNGEAFIARTLESVLNQNLGDFEVLISDNQSQDSTIDIIKSYRDRRITVFQNESNLGLERNWNKVLSLASGKYVKLLCADDVLYPECLSRQTEILEDPAYAKAVLAVCNRDVIDTTDRVILHRRLPVPHGLIGGQKLIRGCVRLGTNLIGEPAVGLFRREVLSRIGVWDPPNPFVIDLAFWAEVLKHGGAFIDPRRLAAFRVSGATASARIGFRQAAHFRQFIRWLRKDTFYRVSGFDAISGYFLSVQWCLVRNAFTRSYANKAGGRSRTGYLTTSCVPKREVHQTDLVKKQQCRV